MACTEANFSPARRARGRLAAAVLLLAAGALPAQDNAPVPTVVAAPPGAPVAPTSANPLDGPVEVRADNMAGEIGGTLVYTGDVHLDSQTMAIAGQRLELHDLGRGQFEARITGAPATLHHSGAGTGGDGQQAAPVDAHANVVTYNSRTGIVKLSGNAWIERDGNEITSDSITYDVRSRTVQADKGAGEQIRLVIQPEILRGNINGKPPRGPRR